MIRNLIPKVMQRKISRNSKQYFHYELVKIYPHHVVYKCKETGKLESFCKSDFRKEVDENKKIERISKHER